MPAHNATDMAALARGYVKWDYQPDNLQQFTNGMFRAYRLDDDAADGARCCSSLTAAFRRIR